MTKEDKLKEIGSIIKEMEVLVVEVKIGQERLNKLRERADVLKKNYE